MEYSKGHNWFISRLSLFGAFLISAPIITLGFSEPFVPARFAIALLSAVLFFIVLYFIFTHNSRRRMRLVKGEMPSEWNDILKSEVKYYNALPIKEKKRFEALMKIFLGEKHITPIDTEINEKDRVLTAAGAIIPIFKLPGWEYSKLNEILIYPGGFNENYEQGKGGRIMGLVDGGTTMILSRTYLYSSFKDADDGTNVGIHEFVHKIDGADGSIDGIPSFLLSGHGLIESWRKIMADELGRIRSGRSDINPYGGTNEAEFFSVVSEYFFEAPAKMKRKHQKLYDILKKIYRQDTFSLFNAALKDMIPVRFGRRSK